MIARDVAGNTASAAATFTVIQPVVAEVPAPVGALISAGPPVNGIVTVSGGPGAIQPGLQVQVLNSTNEATATAVAGADGAFSAQLEAAAGDVLSVRAIDASRNESGAIGLGVPEPARLLSITVSPAAVALSPANRSQQLSVIGTFDDASQRPVVAGVTFTVLESAVASVTSLGLLLPGGNGETTVRVELAGVAPVLVPVTTAFPTVVGVVVSPASVQLAEVAQKQQLTVRAEMSDGSLQPFQGSVEFGSTNTAIASVDTNGLITAVGEGAATVVVVPAGFDPLDVEVTVASVPVGGPQETAALTFSVLNLAGATGGQPLAREATALPFSVLNTAVGGGAPVAAEAHTVPFSVLNTAGANGQPTAKEAAALPFSVLNTASASVGPPVPFEAAAKPFSALNLSGPGNGQMVWSLLVSNRGTNSIMQYDATTGAFIRAMVPSGAGGLNLPDGILVGPTGDLFAASNRDAPSTAAVLRYNGLTGALTGTFVPTTGGALNITSMVFGPNGNLFVSDFLGRDVKEYDQTTGAFVRVFASLANNGCCAQGLAFGPNGNLYVATQASVQEFQSATGAFVKAFAFGAALNPTGAAFGPDGNIYVSTTNGIQRYNPASGELVGTFVAAGTGGLGHAHSLRFGIDGRLYVADTTNNRVLRFDGLTGAFIDEFVSSSGGLSAPFNLTFGWVGR